MLYRAHLCLVFLALWSHLGAQEQREHQRVAVDSYRWVEVHITGGLVLEPTVSPEYRSEVTVSSGSAELDMGVRLWDRLDADVSGRIPVAVQRTGENGFSLGYRTPAVVGVTGGYSFGPVYRRLRIMASTSTVRTAGAGVYAIFVRDPIVHSFGIAGDTDFETFDVVRIQLPLVTALVANDIFSVHAEIIPAVRGRADRTDFSLSAVFSVRWSWERFHIGTATLWQERPGPSAIAMRGGWAWRPKK